MPKVIVVLLCMEARMTGGELKLSEEHDEFAWVPLAEISQRRLPDQVREFMLDYAKRKGESIEYVEKWLSPNLAYGI